MEKNYKYKGKEYKVIFVKKSELHPFFGRAYVDLGYAKVREDLHPLIKKFTIQHELYHLADTKKWGGVFGFELRANIVPGLKNPIGLLSCIIVTLLSRDRMRLYLDRVRKKY